MDDHNGFAANLACGVWYPIVDGPPAGLMWAARKMSSLFSIGLAGHESITLQCDIMRLSRGRALKGGLYRLNIGGVVFDDGRRFSAQYNPILHKGRIKLR